jgi:hypothetical protein
VKITVEHGVGEIETGSGIVLCQSGGRLDVLTAKHVVSGDGGTDAYGAPTGQPFRDVRKVEVAFYRNLLRPMLVAPHDILKAEHDDLAILILRGVEERLQTAAIDASDAIAAAQEVQSVGHHSALRDGDWFWSDGKVRQTGRFLLHSAGFGSAGVAGGFSGGPLYNRAGEVVGINVQRLDDVAWAIPVKEALQTVRQWVAPGCLEPSAGHPQVEKRGPWRDPVLGIDFVYVEPGTFWMGSPASEAGRQDDERRHQVTLTRGFWIATTEVTQGQFAAFVKETGFKTQACSWQSAGHGPRDAGLKPCAGVPSGLRATTSGVRRAQCKVLTRRNPTVSKR